jgi:hypothetical protein
VQVFDYNRVNQLLSATDPAQLFSYDDDGNMLTGYTPEGYLFTAAYDAENRLKSIKYTDSDNTVHRRVYTYRWDNFTGRIRSYENNTLVSDISIVRDQSLALQDREPATTPTFCDPFPKMAVMKVCRKAQKINLFNSNKLEK